MKIKTFTIAILSTCIAVPALADQPSFNIFEGGYTNVEDDVKGYTLRGAMSITDNLYITGGFGKESSETLEELSGGESDLTNSRVGLGTNFAITDNTALYGEIEYMRLTNEIDSELLTDKDTDNGYVAAAGIRSMVTSSTELYGELGMFRFDDNQPYATVGVRQYFTDNLGVFAEYTANDNDIEGYAVGVSVKF